MTKKIILIIVLILAIMGISKLTGGSEDINDGPNKNSQQAFLDINLKTNTSISSIPLEEVLGGGPLKDGIPAIIEPKFIPVADAIEVEEGERFGISVTVGETSRFYPYSILVWHEIVNDVIEEQDVLVTFCPLCGSGIVFDSTGKTFGVSGKLWQSNLLMYDHETETLWSQSIGTAVVGEKTGEKLDIFPSQLISFDEFSEKHPDGEVLSRDTGHKRDYTVYPYGDYDTNENLIFPVTVNDNRFATKEIMYIVGIGNKSVAFKRSDLISEGTAVVDVDGQNITASVDGSEIEVKDTEGNIIPGYHEMWFSWATHHQEDGVVWSR
ncbi:MAG: hypothetical protein ACI8R6_000083 [Candidatus Paceibacteria bacterium]|jgi:hypothetical protein